MLEQIQLRPVLDGFCCPSLCQPQNIVLLAFRLLTICYPAGTLSEVSDRDVYRYNLFSCQPLLSSAPPTRRRCSKVWWSHFCLKVKGSNIHYVTLFLEMLLTVFSLCFGGWCLSALLGVDASNCQAKGTAFHVYIVGGTVYCIYLRGRLGVLPLLQWERTGSDWT